MSTQRPDALMVLEDSLLGCLIMLTLQSVEGAKRICYVLQNATEGSISSELKEFLTYSSTELLKPLTKNIDTVHSAPCVRPSERKGRIASLTAK